MNGRISLTELAQVLRAAAVASADPTINGYQCGTRYDPNFSKDVASSYPYVWAMAQRMTSKADNSASSLYCQTMTVEVAFKIVDAQYYDGEVAGDAEARLNKIGDFVVNTLANYSPNGAFTSFILVQSRDGAAAQTLISIDLVLSATVIYRRP